MASSGRRGSWIDATKSVQGHADLNHLHYKRQGQEELVSMAENEDSLQLLDRVKEVDANLSAYSSNSAGGTFVLALGVSFARMNLLSNSLLLELPTIATYKNDTHSVPEVERFWTSHAGEDELLREEESFYIVWTILWATSHTIITEQAAGTDICVDAGRVAGTAAAAAAAAAGAAYTGGRNAAVLAGLQAAASSTPLRAELSRQRGKRMERRVTTRSVVAYKLREMVWNGEKWKVGNFYSPTDDERACWDDASG